MQRLDSSKSFLHAEELQVEGRGGTPHGSQSPCVHRASARASARAAFSEAPSCPSLPWHGLPSALGVRQTDRWKVAVTAWEAQTTISPWGGAASLSSWASQAPGTRCNCTPQALFTLWGQTGEAAGPPPVFPMLPGKGWAGGIRVKSRGARGWGTVPARPLTTSPPFLPCCMGSRHLASCLPPSHTAL